MMDDEKGNMKRATGQGLGVGHLTCLEIQCGDHDNACVVDLFDAVGRDDAVVLGHV